MAVYCALHRFEWFYIKLEAREALCNLLSSPINSKNSNEFIDIISMLKYRCGLLQIRDDWFNAIVCPFNGTTHFYFWFFFSSLSFTFYRFWFHFQSAFSRALSHKRIKAIEKSLAKTEKACSSKSKILPNCFHFAPFPFCGEPFFIYIVFNFSALFLISVHIV